MSDNVQSVEKRSRNVYYYINVNDHATLISFKLIGTHQNEEYYVY